MLVFYETRLIKFRFDQYTMTTNHYTFSYYILNTLYRYRNQCVKKPLFRTVIITYCMLFLFILRLILISISKMRF